jgi:N,N'-diacetyllegionaminate synthase
MTDTPVFVIAEAGVNHNGDIALAHRLVDAAADAGADAVKFQTFRAERVAGAESPKAAYQKETTDAAESQLDMLRKLELPWEAHAALKRQCDERNIEFMSTPFDPDSADFLVETGIRRFKTGSGELTNLPFLEHAARHGLPMILSTGMATLEEIGDAVEAVRKAGAGEISLLHCVSNYPAAPEDTNLRAMQKMADAFDVPVGLSDHTMGIAVATGAAALGASIIEKHFTLDRTMTGPDHLASIEPDGLKQMVDAIRTVTAALGDGEKRPAESERENRVLVRRSLVAACDIAAGEILADDMIDAKRPGDGLPPAMRSALVGRRANRDILSGAQFAMEMFD